MIPAAVAAKQLGALNNDLAVYRSTKTKGKGRHRRRVDVEYHVNPVSIALAGTALAVGLGVAAVGVSVALFASGLQAERSHGVTKTRIIRPQGKGKLIVYNEHGFPLHTFTGTPRSSEVLSAAEVSRGWVAGPLVDHGGDYWTVDISNDDKGRFKLSPRPHVSLINGKLF